MSHLHHISSWILAAFFLPTIGFAQHSPSKGVAVAQSASPHSVRRALIVGINEYQHLPHLRFCAKDAALLASTLRAHCGYGDDHVIVLTDGAKPLKDQPTRSSILQAAAQVSGVADKEDLVLIFLSGHGISVEGKSYFVPVEASGAKGTEMVSIAELRDMLRASHAARRVLILDACHSGGEKSSNDNKMTKAFEDDLHGNSEGIITLASCRSEETSLEAADRQQGLFTYWLVQGLVGLADRQGDRNRLVDVLELYKYVSEQVKTEASSRYRHFQRPKLLGELSGEIVLAKLDESPSDSANQGGTNDSAVTENPDCRVESGRLLITTSVTLRARTTEGMKECKSQLRRTAEEILRREWTSRGHSYSPAICGKLHEDDSGLDGDKAFAVFSIQLPQ